MVCARGAALGELGYTKRDIMSIAQNAKGAQALQTLHEYHAALRACGHSTEHILSLASQSRDASVRLKDAARVAVILTDPQGRN
jgi:hypothetical protein